MTTVVLAAAAVPWGAVLTAILPYLLLLAVLLTCSAFFSGSESAFFSLDAYALDKLDEEDSASTRAVRELLEKPRRLLATILLGNEFVNITISAVGLRALFEVRAAGVALPWWANILVVTPLLLMFGEIAPKAVAVRTSSSWARLVALPLKTFGTLVSPLRAVLHGAANLLLSGFGATQPDLLAEALQEAQFKALVDLGEAQGVLDRDEAELIHRVFDLSDTPVSRVMTARVDVVSVDLKSALVDLVSEASGRGLSRLPVYDGEPDNIKGILLTKDLLAFRWTDQELTPRALEGLLKPPYFVPPGKPAVELLQEFRRERGHMALVIDEYGSLLGIVTMQDLLEELFELFGDELAIGTDGHPIERLAEGVYRVPARVEVDEWNRAMDPEIPVSDAYNTLAGYVFHLFGRLPRKGEQIQGPGWTFRIAGLEGTRLTSITATRRSATSQTATALRPVGDGS